MKYPFNQIIVMSLERTPERYERWRGAAAILKIDPNIISIAFGKDNLDFDDDSQKVAEAAADDGFPFITEYAQDKVEHGLQQNAATVCQAWNYCRILRELIERQETSLIIFDDKMLTVDFKDFCRVAEELQDVKGEEFYAAQLNLRGHTDELNFPEIDLNQRIRTSLEVFQGAFGGMIDSYRDLFFRKGIMGYDESILFSPAGAEWMLKCLDMAPDYYRYLDHFICHALPDFAKSAIKRDKGIYCPAEIGYQFVDVFMEMGTTTDYAIKNTPMYEPSRRKVPINYFFNEPKGTHVENPKETQLKTQLDKVLKGS